MNRFNKFLSFLEDPASLNTEEVQLIQEHINSFPEFTPNIRDELVLSYAYSEFNFELEEDRQLCMQVMKSPIFHEGGLKSIVNKPAGGWKIYEIDNIECFIMHLSTLIKRNKLNYHSNLECEIQYKINNAISIKQNIENTKFIINLLPDLGLASKKQVSLLIKQIDRLVKTINNNKDHLNRKIIRKAARIANYYDNIVLLLPYIFWYYAPNLNFAPLVKRIGELLNFLKLNPYTSARIKKQLQRAQITRPPSPLAVWESKCPPK